MGTLHEDQYTFIFHQIFLRMRNVWDKCCRAKNKVYVQ